MSKQSLNNLKKTFHLLLRKMQKAKSYLMIILFQAGNEICGVVVSTRYQEYLLSIWNRTASDQATTSRIRDALKRLLNLPSTATMEYKTHKDCLKYGYVKNINTVILLF